MFRSIILLLFAAVALQAMPPGIEIEKGGVLKLGGLNAYIRLYDREWQSVNQTQKSVTPTPGYPVSSDKQYELKGLIPISSNPPGFTFQQWVREESADTVSYSMEMQHETGADLRILCFNVELPIKQFAGKTLKINDQSFELPEQTGQKIDILKNVKKLELVNEGKIVRINGDFSLQIQDNRSFKGGTYSLRLLFPQSSGTIKSSKFTAKLSVTPFASKALALNGAKANSFQKEFGLNPKNDSFKGIQFKLDSFLTLANGKSAVIPAKAVGAALYLMHGGGADLRPELEVVYTDGARKKYQLTAGQDFSGEKPLQRLPNGAVVASNNDTYQGLYLSYFPLEKKEIAELRLTNSAASPWFIAGASLTDLEIPVGDVDSIVYIRPGDEWVPLESAEFVKRGSALDFSGMLDAPAGKYGRITVDAAGHFAAAGKRFRFYGPNFCFSGQFLERKEAEAVADELAALGYNAVRLHHFDNELGDKNGPDSKVFLPEQLDKLDYFFHCLKERGIYVTLDLYCSRKLRPGEITDIPDATGRVLKEIAPIAASGRENWKAYVRKFLGHKNPYTGLTWAEDPTLFGVSLINENNIYSLWNRENVRELYLAGYVKYLQENQLDTPENRSSRGTHFLKYLTALHVDMIQDFRKFLREEVNYQGLITDLNFREYVIQSEIRRHLDFTDTHSYWDHPRFSPQNKWSFPYIHNQNSVLRANAIVPRMLFASRIFGQPFTVTEINYVFPNRYRAEGGPVLGAYAALQDWDGIFRFSWSHSYENTMHQRPIERFDIVRDPISLIAERIINLMFVRGDVKPAPSAVGWTFGDKSFEKLASVDASHYPHSFQEVGFYCRIGSIPAESKLPGVQTLPDNKLTTELQKITGRNPKKSETGEISYNPGQETFRVISPKTESLTLSKGGLKGSVLAVNNVDSFQSITVSALDNLPLAESKRILVFHQSDVTNENIRFSSGTMNAVEHWGGMKRLIRKAAADITLNLPDCRQLQALSLDGTPKADIPFSATAGGISFRLDTAAYNGTMIYLISR